MANSSDNSDSDNDDPFNAYLPNVINNNTTTTTTTNQGQVNRITNAVGRKRKIQSNNLHHRLSPVKQFRSINSNEAVGQQASTSAALLQQAPLLHQYLLQSYQHQPIPVLDVNIQDFPPTTSTTATQHDQVTNSNFQRAVNPYSNQFGDGNSNNNNDHNLIVLERRHNGYNARFRVHTNIYDFKFVNYNGDILLENFILTGFRQLLDRITEDTAPDDLIGIKIEVYNQDVKPIGLSFRPRITLSPEMILDLLNSVTQSNSVFSITDLLIITVTRIALPYGGHIVLAHCTDLQILQRKNNSILHAGPTNDNLCLPKAILFGKAWADGNYALIDVYRSQAFPDRLIREAKQLMTRARVILTNLGCNMFSIYKFQRLMPDYTIYVYDQKRNSGNKHFCKAGTGPKEINLFYLKDLRHFVALKTRKMFFGQAYECENCRFLYKNRGSHMCKVKCTQCRGRVNCRTNGPRTCIKCSRTFYNDDCFNTHLNAIYQGYSVCENVFYCLKCEKVIEFLHRRSRVHTCDEEFCKICWSHVPKDHGCYIRPYLKQVPEKYVIVFFDLECMQDENEMGIRKHVANLIVYNQVCELCAEQAMIVNGSSNYHCTFCNVHKLGWFYNDATQSCVHKFITYLETFSVRATAICHNFRGYDSHFLLEELAERSSPVKLTMNGWKVMHMQYKNIRFVDSFNYMTMALADFPKTFGLGPIMKGYYPHKMNSVAMQDYDGILPDKSYYFTDNFSAKQLAEFNEWYNEHQFDRFNNAEQLLDYCIMDVNILKRGCLTFMKMFVDILAINPFLEAVTLPSALMLGFRKQFLRPYTLAILPANEYAGNKKQSKIGRKWLEYENRKVGHAMVFEYKLPDVCVYVDGFLPSNNPQVKPKVFEMWGCWYHFCTHCYGLKSNQYGPTMAIKRESVTRRVERIEARGYEVVQEWECVFRKFLKNNPEIDASLSKSQFLIHSPLKCRDSLLGGYVDVFRTYYRTKPGEKIHFLDIKSMYPALQKISSWPIHHPVVHRGAEQCARVDLGNILGIVKCIVLAPRKLFHPVLPVRHNNRLILGLCMACIVNETAYCDHDDQSRVILGTFLIAEVNLAISKGYRILELIEIWEYETETMDPVTKTGGIFTGYVNKFLKIKESASEGVDLDPAEIAVNPPMRKIGKDSLNALWGKFGENGQLQSTSTVFNDPATFFEHMARPDISIIEVLAWGDNATFVNWKCTDESQSEPLKHGAVPIGSFMTSYGRMCLYKLLDTLQVSSDSPIDENVALYCDTDGIVFIERPNAQYDLPIGDGLGQLNSALTEYGPNAYIIEFVAIGPKAYSYKVLNPDTGVITEVSKCKGISASVKNRKTLNFTNLKALVQNTIPSLEFTNENSIRRKVPFSIVTQRESKNIKFTYSKRASIDNDITVPYGYY